MDGEQYSEKEKMMHDNAFRYKYYRRHIIQYALLTLFFGFSLFFLLRVDSATWRFLIIGSLSLFYLIFGVWHHIEEKNLTNKHTIEYLVVSAIIFVVLYSIFL